eukprot:TRINITY_DN49440_c0_g1_i1.p1 TRINITY_DN49440_c0_g1~~TRINITY_DN49440_c0_g1_i1.p1  ORF type:complete len:524 (+),score=96.03 TRINITY_DN49440_c0_g1_i1:54-1625(+)
MPSSPDEQKDALVADSQPSSAEPAEGGASSSSVGGAGAAKVGPLFSSEDKKSGDMETWQQKLLLVMEEPASSLLAQIVSYVILSMICLSIVSFVLEAEPNLADFAGWRYIEIISTALFTLEYILRFAVCNAFDGRPTRCEFVRSPMNVMDLIAILPFYLELILSLFVDDTQGPIRLLRACRLIRIFRIFRLSKYSMGMALMVQSLLASIQPLMILGFFLCIGVTLFSSLLYYAERMYCPNMDKITQADFLRHQQECKGATFDSLGQRCCDKYGSATGFISIRDTFWWSIVTMTTCGYGDKAPATRLGQFIGSLTMLLGIVLISLPVAIVGSKFQSAYEAAELEHERMLLEERDRKALAEKGAAKEDKLYESLQLASDHASQSQQDSRADSDEAPSDPAPQRPVPPAISVEQTVSKKSLSSKRSQHNLIKSDPPPDLVEKAESLKKELQRLDGKTAMSVAAKEQIKLVLALLENIIATESRLSHLREKDHAMEIHIGNMFAALCRNYEASKIGGLKLLASRTLT